VRLFLLAGLLLLAAALPAAAQGEVDPSAGVNLSTGELVVSFGDLLEDGGLVRALNSGLPLRIQVTGELWRDGFFDSHEGEAEWGASVLYDPVSRLYRVAFVGVEGVRRVTTLQEASALLEDEFALNLRPGREATYYYLAHLEVETLSLSDLEELQRWLRGDLAPAVGGDRGVESAVASGIRRIFVRALGLPAHRERLRTRTFDWDPATSG